MVNIKINGTAFQVEEGTTILQAAMMRKISIPTLCYWGGLNEIGACRVCVVEIAGCEELAPACVTKVEEGMEVLTDSPKAIQARKTNVALILSQHKCDCPSCVRSGNCVLQKVANSLGLFKETYKKEIFEEPWPQEFPLFRDNAKCVKCMRCIQVCENVQGVNIWDLVNTGSRTKVGVAGGLPIDKTKCALCGQCITHCPVGALRERDDTDKVYAAFADPEKVGIVQIAPAIRSAWGEELGLSHEEASPRKLAAVLRALGFKYVFDTDFGADLTIMEEGSEFLERLKNRDKHQWPMFTSCCPGWVRFLKAHHPDMTANLSSAKSPHQMQGAITKTYFAQKAGIEPKDIFNVSIMPCVAKKHECDIPSINDAGAGKDVDAVLTTRELVRMIRASGIDVKGIPEADFDSPLGTGTGAAVIFGATGGVMEAALRSCYYLVTGKNPDADAFKVVRGLDGWKEATVEIAGAKVRAAVASGLGNAEKLIQAVKRGEVEYDFVEIMACPGGCVVGGGQPIHDCEDHAGVRSENLYGLDKKGSLRFSHENPDIAALYKDFLGKPLGEKSHHLLHTDHFGWKMPTEN